MNKPSLQSLLQQQLSVYSQHHKLDSHRLKVCDHLLDCHTPALGGLVYECDHCEREIPLYHSCRDRHCPQCQQRVTREWAEKQQQAVLPVTYYHLVFTLPHELNSWVQLHDDLIYALLFKAVWKTLKAFGADPKRLNGKLGMTAVLHTWGQNLSQHVHLHCLVPGGALGDKEEWHAAKSDYLFPVKALSRHYRGNLVAALRCSANEGKLHRVTKAGEVDQMLDTLMQKEWVVYSRYCLKQTDSIIGYLSRYTHRIAISNQRIIDIKNNQVQFRYKDYRDDRQKLMTLQADEFIRRFLMHILPSGFMRIRHYGLLANRCRAKSIKLIRKILEAVAPEVTKTSDDGSIIYPCPKCKKGGLIFKYKIEPENSWAHPLPS
jgi:predicted RNA-binding Zn-ribbon protein involved in translation (DUF1610 family)